MKNLINLNINTQDTSTLFAHIDYHISDNCINKNTDMICYKCGKCGRKFKKSGLLKQ